MPPSNLAATRDAVLKSSELLGLILEQFASLVARFSDVKLVLRSRAVCKEWFIAASTMRENVKRRWALSCHTVLEYSGDGVGTGLDDGVFVGGPLGIAMFKTANRDELEAFTDMFPLRDMDMQYGLQELLRSLLNNVEALCFAHFVFDEGAQAVAEDAHGAHYVALPAGGVAKYSSTESYILPREQLAIWERATDTYYEQPHLGIALGSGVTAGLCFVADTGSGAEGRPHIVALDAHTLAERFQFGHPDLSYPVSLAWDNGLLWVADCRPQVLGKLVAYSFEAHGPRRVHTMCGLDHPSEICAAHGHLYVNLRDKSEIHILRPEEFTARGKHSLLTDIPHETLRDRNGLTFSDLVVHPELPVILARAPRANQIAVFWSGCMLGNVNYHDAYQQVSANRREEEGDSEELDDD